MTPPAAARPEHWRVDTDADVATLVIPPDARRVRRFEIDCRLEVAAPGPGGRHAMHIYVDGRLEWARQAATQNPGQSDSVDYHFRREMAPGQALRIVVKTQVRQARRLRVVIEAEETLPA